MKILAFFIVVLGSGYYLVSKSEGFAGEGKGMFSAYLPQEQIAKASDALLKNVDGRLQALSLEQQHNMQDLKQQVSALTEQVKALSSQQVIVKQALSMPLEDQTPSQQSDAQQSIENVQVEGLAVKEKATHLALEPSQNKADTDKASQRQRQASLQFISSRMEQLAVSVGSGVY